MLQVSGNIFNKGATLNAGFIEVMKLEKFDCVVLHDIDLLPENTGIIYTCKLSPIVLSTMLDKYNYG